jgi:hypothetical protein
MTIEGCWEPFLNMKSQIQQLIGLWNVEWNLLSIESHWACSVISFSRYYANYQPFHILYLFYGEEILTRSSLIIYQKHILIFHGFDQRKLATSRIRVCVDCFSYEFNSVQLHSPIQTCIFSPFHENHKLCSFTMTLGCCWMKKKNFTYNPDSLCNPLIMIVSIFIHSFIPIVIIEFHLLFIFSCE